MGKTRRNWSFQETSMAFVLYLFLPKKRLDDTGDEVRRLAAALGRTPSAVSLKIWNIASHDKIRQAEGKVGMSHGSKLDGEVWERYEAEGDAYLDQAIQWLLDADAPGTETEVMDDIEIENPDVPEGKERWTLTATRVNQQYFRNSLLENYEGRCCMTGIDVEPVLVASHIKPWSTADPLTERLSPRNGLLLNALHDKAFDRGLITIDQKHRIHVSPVVKHTGPNDQWLWDFDGKSITEPLCNPPSPDFIEYHNDVIFKAG